ncbi:molybdenum cofactor guanylyltransferase MobA [uncultured Alsobacter sp.]|uniref:molybdenum cofactor guanylyltransferase MobA n=1 Tax=uncultured Alsobacter sp. TaxID=1748258 RepID=UPI0025F8F6DF|nr:molybdenum cofactor guanylyltransferase MobA [uncultured Alsobacter sp.]
MDARTVPGVILAGGQSRRMGGGDKPLRLLAGRPLVGHIVDRLAPQCAPLAINANGDPSRYAAFALPVVSDGTPDAGPLGGVLAALDWAADQHGQSGLDQAGPVLTVPGDCPFLPADLVERLSAHMRKTGAKIVCATSLDRRHPLTALWSSTLRDDLRDAVEREGMRRVGDWAARHHAETVPWEANPLDPFFNANTPQDLEQAEVLYARGAAAQRSTA